MRDYADRFDGLDEALTRNQKVQIASALCCMSLEPVLKRLAGNPEAQEFARKIHPLYPKPVDGHIPRSVVKMINSELDESVDWSIPGVAELGAKLGLGPLYKPTPVRTQECPSCGGGNARVREAHADTGMDEMELWCPDCRTSTELA